MRDALMKQEIRRLRPTSTYQEYYSGRCYASWRKGILTLVEEGEETADGIEFTEWSVKADFSEPLDSLLLVGEGEAPSDIWERALEEIKGPLQKQVFEEIESLQEQYNRARASAELAVRQSKETP